VSPVKRRSPSTAAAAVVVVAVALEERITAASVGRGDGSSKCRRSADGAPAGAALTPGPRQHKGRAPFVWQRAAGSAVAAVVVVITNRRLRGCNGWRQLRCSLPPVTLPSRFGHASPGPVDRRTFVFWHLSAGLPLARNDSGTMPPRPARVRGQWSEPWPAQFQRTHRLQKRPATPGGDAETNSLNPSGCPPLGWARPDRAKGLHQLACASGAARN
jgi:hypothetical protein